MTTCRIDRERLERCWQSVQRSLLDARNADGHWCGELSTSALSTATAVVALEMVRRAGDTGGRPAAELAALIAGGIRWLAGQQNADGGWGDTTLSFSNISTTMLCHAAFHAAGAAAEHPAIVARAAERIERYGGIPALRARYGSDKTFSIPILTHCALAGLVPWSEVAPLPFELACIPHTFYKWAQLPVVSYALPALIAIGQVRHHFLRPRLPLVPWLRDRAIPRSLEILERIQPTSGGFLEAAPLTSFVTMSLAGMGRADHPVARRGVEFLVASVRPDGSWPIDTNLATWVTTLSVNALRGDLSQADRQRVLSWLLGQQYRVVHPYTQAAPGGWAWTDLSGGVPDADDTPGAMLALLHLDPRQAAADALSAAACWLIDLQNADGGWPTFCRGWGRLPFDRSAPDLTAHAIRALFRWRQVGEQQQCLAAHQRRRLNRALEHGFRYLERTQRRDGSWLPLWFGNQHAPEDENPTYGTARVVAAWLDTGSPAHPACARGLDWLRHAQNDDGGWGGIRGVPSSTEETSLALEALLSVETDFAALPGPVVRGLHWMLERFDRGKLMEPSPIGFYFAKLWYFEQLYPLIFAAGTLRRAAELALGSKPGR